MTAFEFVSSIHLHDLELRVLEDNMASALLDTLDDERVWRWMPASRPSSHKAMREYITRWSDCRNKGDGAAYAIVRHKVLVGSTALYDYRPEDATIEAGWTWLVPNQWGRGTNALAKCALYSWAFREFQLERLGVRTDAENFRAQRALERFGLVREGVLRRHMRRPDGSMRDTVYYSIVRDEWEQVRERILACADEVRP